MNFDPIDVKVLYAPEIHHRWTRADIGEPLYGRRGRPWCCNWWVLIASLMLQECCRDRLSDTLAERMVPRNANGRALLESQAIGELYRLGHGEACVEVVMPVDSNGYMWRDADGEEQS